MTDNRDRLKQAAAEAAAAQVGDGMVVGLGTGSTAAFAIDALVRRVADGLNIYAIPTSKRSAEQAIAGGIRLTDFATHPRIDLTIDGADQVDVRNLNLIKGMGGALLREKIVAAASERLLIIVDEAKLADELSLAVPVEVTPFGWEATAAHIMRLGGKPLRRLSGSGEAFVTDGGGYILDCSFGAIVDAAAQDRSVREIVGVVETGLFIGMTSSVIVAGASGVAGIATVIIAVMGVSGAGKTTVANALAEHFGAVFQEGDDLHPPENVAKMKSGVPLNDADRGPWLQRVAAWVDAQRDSGRAGVVTCSLLKRAYRKIVIGDRPDVFLLYLHGQKSLIAEHMLHRRGHFMPPGLLDSQFEALEEPAPEEHATVVEIGNSIEKVIDQATKAIKQAISAQGAL